MKVFLVPDSFKNSVNASDIIDVLSPELLNNPKIQLTAMPLCDGGEGTLDTLVKGLKGEIHNELVHNALGDRLKCNIGVAKESAIIELAQASGIEKINSNQLNPFISNTYGTGELIKRAIDRGKKDVVLTLGGSATVDGGIGIVQALGGKFYDKENILLNPEDSVLFNWHSADLSEFLRTIRGINFTIAVDVDNRLLGKNGAVYVFGPQKGVKNSDLQKFDGALGKWSSYLESKYNCNITSIKGSGAAGGAMIPLLINKTTKIISGFELVSDSLDYKHEIYECDWIITGEGKTDEQTFMGKGVGEVIKWANQYKKKVIVVAGINTMNKELIKKYSIYKVFSIMDEASSLHDAMENACNYLSVIGGKISQLIQS